MHPQRMGLITNAHIEGKHIIDTAVYQKGVSLNQLIEQMCDPMIPINDNMLINLCIKFFFAHRNPESCDQRISLKDIERFYAVGLRFFILQREGYTELETTVGGINGDIQYFLNNGYGAAMLGDIAPSVEIFKSIVTEVLRPQDFSNKYLGIDLGTGTGWLMLAQYINARRRGFHDIDIFGVEKSEETSRSTVKLFSKFPGNKPFEAGKALTGDTVSDLSVYDTIKSMTDQRKISYISNENIPTCGVKMTGENDPFFQNIFNIDTQLGDGIIDATRGFPRKIRLIIQSAEKTYGLNGDFQSRYALPDLLRLEEQIHQNQGVYPEGGNRNGLQLQVLKSVYPYGIDVGNGDFELLTKIGRRLESKPGKGGKIYPHVGWRRRWYG